MLIDMLIDKIYLNNKVDKECNTFGDKNRDLSVN